MTTPTLDLTVTIDTYLEAYNEHDEARRNQLIAQVWTVDGHLIDPPIEGKGHDGISAQAVAVHTHFAGNAFRRVTGIDAHHGFARYGWELATADGSVTLGGIDVVQVDDSGKIVRVVGFFGGLPALED